MKKVITINDVAVSAGVSVGTVSRVLNGKPNISPENIQRVRQSIEALRYQKLRTSNQSLNSQPGRRSAKNSSIGLIFPEMGRQWAHHPMIAAYTYGVESVCQENGFHVLVEMAPEDRGVPRCVSQGKVDGLLIKATRGMPSFTDRLPAQFPVVGIGLFPTAVHLHQVAPYDFDAGRTVTDYLWQRGHRRIAFATADALHPLLAARFYGYESYLRERERFTPRYVLQRYNTEFKASPEGVPLDTSWEVGQLLSFDEDDRPTAIVCANDWMARSLYNAFHRRGVEIGRDLSIVGFDNTPGMCDAMTPPLTSYQVPFIETGRAAAQALLERIEDPALRTRAEVQLIRGKIVERGSVVPLEAERLSDWTLQEANHRKVQQQPQTAESK